MDRIDLLNEIYAGRTLLEAQLARLDAERMNTPVLPGGWSARDMLAHLGWWERRSVEIYYELAQGGDPTRPVTPAEVDVVNARILRELRPRSLDWVRLYERRAYLDLLQIVETAPEDDLFDAQRFAWTGGYPFAEWIVGNSSGHYAEHLPDLRPLLGDAPIRVAGGKAPSTGGLVDPEKLVGETGPVRAAGAGEADEAEPTFAYRESRGGPFAAPAAAAVRLHPAVQRAREFLMRQGSALEQALFNYRFGAAGVDGVLEALSRCQNPDGGFTHLELDIAAPQSNPFAVEWALVAFNWIDAPREHPLVRRAVEYLERTQDEDGGWRLAPEIYRHALAPWFKDWQWPSLTPACAIAGLLKRLGLGSDRLHRRVQGLFERLANPADLVGAEFFSARPYACYLAVDWQIPQAGLYRSGVLWWMLRGALAGPQIDAAHFMELAGAPGSAISQMLPPDLLSAQLDRLLAEQDADGGWPTPYPEHWRPWVTITNLYALRSYGRV